MEKTGRGDGSPWFRVTFNQNEVVDDAHFRLLREVREAFVAGGWPPDAALFVDIAPPEQSVFGVYYVSPNGARLAADVLARFAAEPCALPKDVRLGVELQNGDDALRVMGLNLPEQGG